jgi:hypothetical protein
MMRHIFVKVRDDQQQLEHAVALLGIRFAGTFFEILNDGQRVGQQPFEIALLYRIPHAASIEGVVGTVKRFIQEMIEAKLLRRQGGRDRVRARSLATATPNRCVHVTHPNPWTPRLPRDVRQRLPQFVNPGTGIAFYISHH